MPLIREAIANGKRFWAHAFEYACATNDIQHRTIKDATVKRFYCESHDQLRQHLADFVSAHNFARRLKTLKGPMPYEFICKIWAFQPKRFTFNPLQQMPILNI